MNRELLIEELIRDEGIRLVVYDDATGKPLKIGDKLFGHPTIGIGRALDVRGVTKEEASMLLDGDIMAVWNELLKAMGSLFMVLTDARQRVLVNMAFNMGAAGLMSFTDMLRYLQEARYGLAADAMRDSKWYHQVGGAGTTPEQDGRGERLAKMMAAG